MRNQSMSSRYRRFLVPAWLLLSSVVGAQAGPAVWVESSLRRVGRTDAAGSTTAARLWAARGEYESFQVVVQAPPGGLSNVSFSVSDLQGPGGQVIPKASLTLYREHYVYVNQSSPNWGGSNRPLGVGWYTDALIPFNDPATGLPPIDPATGLELVQCACLTYAGTSESPAPYQVGYPGDNSCNLGGKNVWSAAYTVQISPPDCKPDVPGECPLLPPNQPFPPVPANVSCQQVCSEYRQSNQNGGALKFQVQR